MGCRMSFAETYDGLESACMMGKYQLIHIKDANESAWDECVRSSGIGYVYTFYQMLTACEYEQDINLTFAIKEEEESRILLIMPLYLRQDTILDAEDDKCELCSRYGPVIRDGLTKRERIQVKEILLNKLKELLLLYRQKGLHVQLAALCSYGNMNLLPVNPLVFWGFEPGIRYSWIIDLTKGEEHLFQNLHCNTRRAIRRLSKVERFKIRETSPETAKSDCQSFIRLSNETYHRNGMQSKAKTYYENQFFNVSKERRKIFFLEVQGKAEPEAALMVHVYGETGRLTWGGSADIQSKDVMRLLIYKVILELKSQGYKYLEIGGAYPYLPIRDKRRGISDFKKSFGGTLYPIYMGYFDLKYLEK